MTKKENIYLIINSLILLIAAFIVAYLPFQFFTYFLARFFDISTEFDGYKIKYLVSESSSLWNNISIITIFGFPPLFSLLLANVTRRYYKRMKRRKGNTKLFLIWLSLIFDNMFWGAIIAGIATSSGFAYFLNWIYIPKVIQIIIAVLGSILFITLSDFLRVSFLQTAPQRAFINSENQKGYKIKIIFIPLFLALLLLSLVEFPDNSWHEIILRLTIFFPLFKTFKYEEEENIKLVKNNRTFLPEWLVIIFIVGYFVLFNVI